MIRVAIEKAIIKNVRKSAIKHIQVLVKTSEKPTIYKPINI